ncbi:MucB/RseB C-terminal domain-containing protein [Pollutimonas sp. H1-120]|uniref:MucB/RseB C-terminal domain-containing protein n=1 Tax=Pollutimonas sp. H1-120 TaxID=3148824 RepID=UPI003B5242C6
MAVHFSGNSATRLRRHAGRAQIWACQAMLLAAACALAQPAWSAEAAKAAPDPVLVALRKIQDAARKLDYSGVYTYQQGGIMLSSRIVHLVDGTGERERIEMLDGPPREYLRHNETTQCLVPEKKLVVIERRRGDRFPALLLGEGKTIPENYQFKLQAGLSRIAGRECSIIELIPKDAHRYGYRLCADTKTSLLLKAQTLNQHGGVIDQISFSSLQVGDKVASGQLASSWNIQDWKVLETTMAPVDLAKNGWRIPFPPGYQPVTQVSRPMKRGRQVSQLVITDGLAAISVFIEPYEADRDTPLANGAVSTGAMNIFRARIGDHWLTALGEVPAETVRDIAEHTEYVPLAGH